MDTVLTTGSVEGIFARGTVAVRILPMIRPVNGILDFSASHIGLYLFRRGGKILDPGPGYREILIVTVTRGIHRYRRRLVRRNGIRKHRAHGGKRIRRDGLPVLIAGHHFKIILQTGFVLTIWHIRVGKSRDTGELLPFAVVVKPISSLGYLFLGRPDSISILHGDLGIFPAPLDMRLQCRCFFLAITRHIRRTASICLQLGAEG